MKMWKKTMVLLMAFGMTFGMAACGGDDDGGNGGGVPGEDVKGEAVTQEEWNAAWEATLSATNLTMNYVKTYEEVGEGDPDWEEAKEEGFIKVADGKQWAKSNSSEVWDYSAYDPDDKGEETDSWEEYYGTIDGVAYHWYYEENQWNQWPTGNDDFATGAGVIYEMFEDFDHEWLYEQVTYNSSKGAYTYSWQDGEEDELYDLTIEIKLKDGKVVAGKQTVHCDDQGEGYEIDQVIACSITYGDAEIGKLPGEEGFGEEEEDEGEGAGGEIVGGETVSGEAGGEIVGGEEESSNAGGESVGGEIGTVEGAEVDEAGWNAAIEATQAADNFSANLVNEAYMNNECLGSVTAILYVADDKGYMESITGESYYNYTGNVDGISYSWESSDGENWTCEKQGEAISVNGAWMLEELLPSTAFSDWTYNAEQGCYVHVEDTSSVTIYLKDGKVAVIALADIGVMGEMTMIETMIYTITYGGASVGELPPVENVTDGESVSGGTVQGGAAVQG